MKYKTLWTSTIQEADFRTDVSPVSECETDDSVAQSVTATSAKKIQDTYCMNGVSGRVFLGLHPFFAPKNGWNKITILYILYFFFTYFCTDKSTKNSSYNNEYKKLSWFVHFFLFVLRRQRERNEPKVTILKSLIKNIIEENTWRHFSQNQRFWKKKARKPALSKEIVKSLYENFSAQRNQTGTPCQRPSALVSGNHAFRERLISRQDRVNFLQIFNNL